MNADQAKGLAEFLVESLKQEFETTKKILAAVPQEQLAYKLGEKGRTMQQLMWHIVNSELWFSEGIGSGSFPAEQEPTAPGTVSEIVERFEQEVPGAIQRVARLSGETLATPTDFMGMFKLPAVVYLNFWLVHAVHHRGQLSTYLRSLDAVVPSIYGPSADAEYPAAAGA